MMTRNSYFFIKPQNDPSRGQVRFCHNLITNLFEKGNSPCKQEFPEVKLKRETPDYYLKDICNITSYYGIYLQSQLHHKTKSHKTTNTTDDINIEFSKDFTDYIKNKQHQKLQRTKQYSQTMHVQSSIAIYP